MSQFVALFAWGRDAEEPGFTAAELEHVLELSGAHTAHLERAPGAYFASVTTDTDGSPGGCRQAVVDEKTQMAVVADCRFDDRGEALTLLASDRDATDAALLLRAYQVWGDDFPGHLKGDFAGAIWDWGRQRLFGFRDRLGVKPLFYAVRPRGVAIASDVQALIALSADIGSPDDQLIIEHLVWDYQSNHRTFWTGLRRLDGGHVLVVSPGGAKARRYWFPPAHDRRPVTTEAMHEQFRDLFFQSVKRRLDTDHPMLAHLSGGIDSSVIVCVADKIHRQSTSSSMPLRAISARYPEVPCDEGSYIEAVTQAIALPAESWDGRSDDFPDLDAPSPAGPGLRSHRSDGSRGEFVIARRVGSRAILSGVGGDQLGAPFGVAEERVRRRPALFAWRTLARSDLTRDQRALRARFLLRTMVPDSARALVAAYRGRKRAPGWLQPRWRDLVGHLAAQGSHRPFRQFSSAIQEAHWRGLTSIWLGHALDADHRIAAPYGVEMRYPFLDQDVVSFVLSLPLENWPSIETSSRLHRTALADLLPSAVRDRTTKAKFSCIVARRVKRAESRLRSLFFAGEWASERWVDRHSAQRLAESALSGSVSEFDWPVWQGVWAIGTLEAWLRSVLGYYPAGWDLRA